jgi:hypothetical protein
MYTVRKKYINLSHSWLYGDVLNDIYLTYILTCQLLMDWLMKGTLTRDFLDLKQLPLGLGLEFEFANIFDNEIANLCTALNGR